MLNVRQTVASAIGLALLAGGLAGCGQRGGLYLPTDPAAKGKELSKVAVVCMTDNEGVRRMAEDEVARQVKTAKVVPGYQALVRAYEQAAAE